MKALDAARRALSREALIVRKNSPHIFFVAGVVGVIGGTVLACKATLKLEKTLEECKQDLLDVKLAKEAVEATDREVAIVYTKNVVKVAKIYAPAAGVMFISIAALTQSHTILSKRNKALTAAYSSLLAAFESYRARVREVVGEEKERDLYFGAIDGVDENGDPIKIIGDQHPSANARWFDETSSEFQKDAEMNRVFVLAQEHYANQRLTHYGHVFLNEVYDMLGMDRTGAGAILGWVSGPGRKNYIDFGVFEARNSKNLAGWERNLFLDFNIDGNILGEIDRRKA